MPRAKANSRGVKVEFSYPVNVRFKCDRCGLCCGDTPEKTRHILLLEPEARKIAVHTSKPMSDFLVTIGGKQPYSFEMKKSRQGKCVFLGDSNQCSIYPLRPLICICYPFELKFNKHKELYNFDFTVECPGINQGRLLGKTDFKKLFEVAQERLS